MAIKSTKHFAIGLHRRNTGSAKTRDGMRSDRGAVDGIPEKEVFEED